MRRFVPLLLALVTACHSAPPPKPPEAPKPPLLTYALANEWMWSEEAVEAVHAGLRDINTACGRVLLKPAKSPATPAFTIHHKGQSYAEAKFLGFLIGGTVLGLADQDSNSFALYPAAFRSSELLRNTTTHEALHLLGLKHNDDAHYSVMHSGISETEEEDQISSEDVADMNRNGWACPGGVLAH